MAYNNELLFAALQANHDKPADHSGEGYDTFQQDPSEWTGSRANYKNS